MGAPVAQLVERTPYTPKLSVLCSGHGFDSFAACQLSKDLQAATERASVLKLCSKYQITLKET